MAVFIIVKIDNLKDVSREIPEIVNNDDKRNKDIIKTITDRKYLLISTSSIFTSNSGYLFKKIFLGRAWRMRLLIENLNSA